VCEAVPVGTLSDVVGVGVAERVRPADNVLTKTTVAVRPTVQVAGRVRVAVRDGFVCEVDVAGVRVVGAVAVKSPRVPVGAGVRDVDVVTAADADTEVPVALGVTTTSDGDRVAVAVRVGARVTVVVRVGIGAVGGAGTPDRLPEYVGIRPGYAMHTPRFISTGSGVRY
jgi:hypothetical protein